MSVFLEIIVLLMRLLYYYVEAFIKLFIPSSPKNIKGQVVLVTGGARGIGRALAFKFAGHGAKVAVLDVIKDGCEETAEAIRAQGGTSQAYYCDITSPEAVKKMAGEVRRDLGEVDILVNNAGVMKVKKVMDLSEEEIRRTIDINATAHFWTVREFLPKMVERNRGHIVCIASMAGKFGAPMLTDYCASKYAAVGFSESLREELRRDNVTGVGITVVCPMFVNTNLISDHAGRITMKDRFGKFLTPEEVADATVKGTLINKPTVYVPPEVGAGSYISLLTPGKFGPCITDFLDARFVSNEK